jgi:hypothetical protein
MGLNIYGERTHGAEAAAACAKNSSISAREAAFCAAVAPGAQKKMRTREAVTRKIEIRFVIYLCICNSGGP